MGLQSSHSVTKCDGQDKIYPFPYALTCFMVKSNFCAHPHPIQLCHRILSTAFEYQSPPNLRLWYYYTITLDACVINLWRPTSTSYLSTQIVVCDGQDMKWKTGWSEGGDDNFLWEFSCYAICLGLNHKKLSIWGHLRFNPNMRKKIIAQYWFNKG